MTPAELSKLKRMPEFAALEKVCAALLPLKPEGRRKVIEAAHTLLEISAGRAGGEDRGPEGFTRGRR